MAVVATGDIYGEIIQSAEVVRAKCRIQRESEIDYENPVGGLCCLLH